MSNRVTLKDEWEAYMDVAPGITFIFLVSFITAISRVIYMIGFSGSNSFIAATGLFSPWFTPWVISLASAVYLSAYSCDIDRIALKKASEKAKLIYGANY